MLTNSVQWQETALLFFRAFACVVGTINVLFVMWRFQVQNFNALWIFSQLVANGGGMKRCAF